jgi:ABC-type uncharacterized transport system ATPase subunit
LIQLEFGMRYLVHLTRAHSACILPIPHDLSDFERLRKGRIILDHGQTLSDGMLQALIDRFKERTAFESSRSTLEF